MGLSIAIEEPAPADGCAPIAGGAAMPPEVCPPEERFPMTAEDLASPGSGSWWCVSAAGLSEAWRCWDGAVRESAAPRAERAA